MKYTGTLSLHALPDEVVALFQRLDVPPYLLAHLILVHDVAVRLVDGIHETWPDLAFDRDAVFYGAATHDIGKVQHPEEMIGPGSAHHFAGVELLSNEDVVPSLSRFSRTHATWNEEDSIHIEDLLVALADVIWAGGRDRRLEDALTELLASPGDMPLWRTYMHLDDLITEISVDAELRLIWQTQFAPTLDSSNPDTSEN